MPMKSREIAWCLIRVLIFCQLSLVLTVDAAQAETVRYSTTKILLHGKTLDIHLAIPETRKPGGYYVLYASGDGGWFGTAAKMFKEFARDGFLVAGFSSKSYLKLLGNSPLQVSLEELVRDYAQIVRAFDPNTGASFLGPVILAGWSRGAAFSVLVGSDPSFKPRCAGVIGFGLPDKEELKIHRHGKHVIIANWRPHLETVLFDTFERIPEIAPSPVALIQSTRDDYLPAASARVLFGQDSETRKMFAIHAENHRFSGGWPEFQKSLRESLEWIVARKPGLQDLPEQR
jgi:hypothetical protein